MRTYFQGLAKKVLGLDGEGTCLNTSFRSPNYSYVFSRSRKLYRRFIAILIIACIQSMAFADTPSLVDKIEKLNRESINTLGISLNALAYLMNASADSYMPLSYLEESGEIDYIKELANAGYLKVNIILVLPDGREFQEKMVNLQPLMLGLEAQRYLLALKHDK